MNKETKAKLFGALNTFLATFFSVLAIQFAAGTPIEWTGSFLLGVIVIAARTAIVPAMKYAFSIK